MKIPRLVLSGTSSGVGKTSIACAVIYGLQQRGYTVQPFKVGPDYIDPSYLSSISKKDTFNLDVWIMGKDKVLQNFVKHSKSDISIVEGVMGFYDGFSGNSNFSSTHHVSVIIKSPVILILDASKTARSIAATALGFKKFHRNSHIVGIILNKIGSKKHELLCKDALKSIKIPIIGVIPKNNEITLSSRHLGLIPTGENTSITRKLIQISKHISNYIDFEKLIKLAQNTVKLESKPIRKNNKVKACIAVALDSSFNFYYQDNFRALQQQGCEMKFFSPINALKIPKCDGIYLGGGFPEVCGLALQKNSTIRKQLKKLGEDEIPMYAECGGLMYLTKSISFGAKKFKMTGLYDAETIMTKKMKLNYTKGKFLDNCLVATKNSTFQGHEFHYSELSNIPKDSKFAYLLDIGHGIQNNKDGLMIYNTLASYGHLYFSSSNYAENLANRCISFSRR